MLNMFRNKRQIFVVCKANICRSPLAHALLQRELLANGLSEQFRVSSAGTRVTAPGHKPDTRAVQVAEAHGLKLKGIRASRLRSQDIVRSDYVLLMDRQNLEDTRAMCPDGHREKLMPIMDFSPRPGIRDVPDPYYGSRDEFQRVFDLLDEAVTGFANYLMDNR